MKKDSLANLIKGEAQRSGGRGCRELSGGCLSNGTGFTCGISAAAGRLPPYVEPLLKKRGNRLWGCEASPSQTQVID
jgi:hypothetical protein